MHSLRHISAALVVTAALAMCAGLAAVLVTPATAHAGVAKGIISPQLEGQPADSTERAALVREIDRSLGARWVRVIADWRTLEPSPGEYAAAELARLDALIGDLHKAGVKVVLTTCYAPAWATDPYWWDHPPGGYAKGPQPFYPVRSGALDEYADFAELLARRYKGGVQALECWNEPNLWGYIYPQQTADDPYFAARTYLKMLKAFRAGVKRARTGVRIVAGATAPVGLNDRYRTSPQRFARFLRSKRAGRFFDVYSHHPYTPGGSMNSAPDQPPNDPTTTVTLYNLRTLLRLFPTKPFYLTEYAYNTRSSIAFGGFAVDETTQARYLRTAYKYATRYRQVRMLLWFLVTDAPGPSGAPELGVYTGLRRHNGERKPSWYAFKRL